MKKTENRELFKDLRNRVDLKFQNDIIQNNNKQVDLFTFLTLLRDELNEYNEIFVTEFENFRNKVNNRIDSENAFVNNIAYIGKIHPHVSGDLTPNYILIDLKDGRSESANTVGYVKYYDNTSFDVRVNNSFNKNKTYSFYNRITFYDTFDYLMKFNRNYPGFDFEWNTPSNDKVMLVKDELLQASIDLEKLNDIKLSFSQYKDMGLYKYNKENYEELIYYINHYRNYLMKRIKVNLEKLNPLYKVIINRALFNEKMNEIREKNMILKKNNN